MQNSSSVMFHSQTTAFGTFGGDSTVLNDGYVICNSMRNGAPLRMKSMRYSGPASASTGRMPIGW